MNIRKNTADADVVATDGTASHSLRELGDAGVVSRRGVLWRAGLATAGGVAALTVLDAQRADAATGGNFILGNANNAGATTTLTPTTATNSNPLLQINGAALSATSTTMIVNGPAGGAALAVTGASTSTTIGLAIVGTGTGTALGIVGSSGSNSGVTGDSTSGTGVVGNSTSGTGVVGTSGTGDGVHGNSSAHGRLGVIGTDSSLTGGFGVRGASTKGIGVHAVSTSGTALYVNGKVHFSRSGSGTIATGHSSLAVSVPGLTSSSLVIVTLQKVVSGVYVLGVSPTTGHFTVNINKNAPTSMKFAWFVLSG
jgi:hypothetical protein